MHFIDIGGVSVAGGNWKALLKFRKVKKVLKKVSPDIFHSIYATSYGVTGALCNFHPYVITALGTDVLISPKKSKIFKMLLKFAFSKADWITAMSDHMKIEIENLDVNEKKVSTVPFGIDPKIFYKKGIDLPSDKFVITSTRNFEKIYNIPHLIKAVVIAKEKIPSIHLNLIGLGSLKSEYEELIQANGLYENVSFLGFIPQPQIADVLNSSHLFVSVSMSDGNNISLNEAMACGTYCIATDIPANLEWIKDGQNGFLVKIDDVQSLSEKIITVYEHFSKLQETAIPINMQIIEQRGIWASNMKQVEKKYDELIHKK